MSTFERISSRFPSFPNSTCSPYVEMDPLSIAASTVALATLATKVSKTVYGFATDTRDVDVNVQNLYRGLRSLSTVLTNVSTAWTENPLVAVAHTGPDGNLWICVKDSVGDCELVLKKLERVLDKVSAENGVGKGFMRRPMKQLRLNLSKKDIEGFGGEIQAYERALSIAFNAINTCAAIRRDHTDIEVKQRLGTIETGIQELLQSLQQRQSSSISYTIEATKTFEQFLRAADTFKSSASTIINDDGSTVRGLYTSQDGGSILGESLSDDRYEIIQSWIPPAIPLGSHQHSLPELMALLGKVTQMADQYRNSEEEKNSNKDEQLRSFEMETESLKRQLEEAQSHISAKRIESIGYIRNIQTLTTIQHELNFELIQKNSRLSDMERRDVGTRSLIEESKDLARQAKALNVQKSSIMGTRIRKLEEEMASTDNKYTLSVRENTKYIDNLKALQQELDEAQSNQHRLQVEVAWEKGRATNAENSHSHPIAELEVTRAHMERLEMALVDASTEREEDLARTTHITSWNEIVHKKLAALQEQQIQLASYYLVDPRSVTRVERTTR